MGIMTERRTARRYDLSLPVIIRVPAERVADTQKGKTRDISTRGVYFVLDEDLEPGSELEAVATASGRSVLPHRRTRGQANRRAGGVRNEPQSGSRDSNGKLPAGPVL